MKILFIEKPPLIIDILFIYAKYLALFILEIVYVSIFLL